MVKRRAFDGGWWFAMPGYGAGVDDDGSSRGSCGEERRLRWERGGSWNCAKKWGRKKWKPRRRQNGWLVDGWIAFMCCTGLRACR